MMSFSKHNYFGEWQTKKQSAMFYLLLTFLVMPSGICSLQDQLTVPHSSAADLHAMLDLSPLRVSNNPSIGGSVRIYEIDPASSDADSRDEIKQQSIDSPPFQSIVLQAAKDYDVDPSLIRAIIMAESNYNPRAVSHRGAQGLMQLMPTTAKWLGVKDVFDPAANIDAGVRYFKRLLDRFDGNIELALAAYNAGSRYVRKYKGIPPFEATQRYIKKVLKYHQRFSDELAAIQLST
jgi:hypothetical protein